MKTMEELFAQNENSDEEVLSEGRISMALAERKIAFNSKLVTRERDPIKQNIYIARMLHTLAVSLTYLDNK